ncbi:hypothetical protein Sjap_014903 [Stephania japonica]|uniref:Bifunctional inhibitor/plant lipid transfer protein/seed storage helical domain-containing protein n=1 Tax=Stephania japonica TaxID=461633 RepID=A0AAP0II50_9MAGN
MNNKHQHTALFIIFITTLVLLSSDQVQVTMAACNPSSLAPCAGAFLNGTPPSPACCSELRAQKACFCQFKKDPSLGRYANSPYTRKTLAACGLPYPAYRVRYLHQFMYCG